MDTYLEFQYKLISFLNGCIEYGFLFTTLSLFILQKWICKFFNINLIVKVNNLLLLTFTIFYFLSIIIELFQAYFSGIQGEQYALTNMITGPYMIFFLFSILSHFVLPLLFINKNLRGKLLISIIIIAFWIANYFLIGFPSFIVQESSWEMKIKNEFNLNDYLLIIAETITYLILLASFYFLSNKIKFKTSIRM